MVVLPFISQIEDRFTFITDKITGRKLKISGKEDEVGIFFAETRDDGSYSKDESTWIQIKQNELGTNLPKTLEFYLPENLKTGKSYILIIKTANGASNRINKTLRTLIYENPILVA